MRRGCYNTGRMLDEKLQLYGIYSYINSEKVNTDPTYSDLRVCMHGHAFHIHDCIVSYGNGHLSDLAPV